MTTQADVINGLKNQGHKITKTRKALVEILENTKQPLSVPEVVTLLKNNHLSPNKTTIYRELTFLLDQGIVQELDFGDSKKRYELDTQDHHHHLVCINCKKIEDFDLSSDLDKEEKKILKDKNFKVISHSLEFFGYCKDCR